MNKIHPTVIIGKDVILGDGNEILRDYDKT